MIAVSMKLGNFCFDFCRRRISVRSNLVREVVLSFTLGYNLVIGSGDTCIGIGKYDTRVKSFVGHLLSIEQS